MKNRRPCHCTPFLRRTLATAAKLPAPKSIPISGDPEKIAARNYLAIYFAGRRENIHSAFESLKPDGNALLHVVAGERIRETNVTLSSLSRRKIEIIYYFKSQEFTFHCSWKFLLFWLLKIHWAVFLLEAARQKVFNKRKLTRSKRIKALQIAVKNATERNVPHVVPWNLMAGSIHRVVKHPEHSLVLAQCEFILESFVESGELAKDGPLRYKVLPKALATLDNYDLEQRRHRTLQLLQLVGAAVAAGQLLGNPPIFSACQK